MQDTDRRDDYLNPGEKSSGRHRHEMRRRLDDSRGACGGRGLTLRHGAHTTDNTHCPVTNNTLNVIVGKVGRTSFPLRRSPLLLRSFDMKTQPEKQL